MDFLLRYYHTMRFWYRHIPSYDSLSLIFCVFLSARHQTVAQAIPTSPWRWCCSTWKSRQRSPCTQCVEPASGAATWVASLRASPSVGLTCTTLSCWMWTWHKTCNTTSTGKGLGFFLQPVARVVICWVALTLWVHVQVQLWGGGLQPTGEQQRTAALSPQPLQFHEETHSSWGKQRLPGQTQAHGWCHAHSVNSKL